jgi:hypothetical protein
MSFTQSRLQGNRMRAKTIVILSLAAGIAGAAATTSESTFVVAFCFVFWTAIVGAVLFLARASWAGEPEEIRSPEVVDPDPWVDADGVRHFPGDVFDIENHPRTGAHGHL